MNRAGQLLLDLLYPNVCDCCGAGIAYDRLICAECEKALAGLRADYAAWAAQNHNHAVPWADGAVVFRYEGAAKAGVLAAKDGARGFLHYASAQIAEAVRLICEPQEISFVTWVPVTRQRRLAQGYAHAETLGKYCAAALHVPARGGYLKEIAGSLRQHSLSAEDRIIYAQRFQRTGKSLSGETVLLCDDILTTGSTLRRCTELLLEAGAKSVCIAAACCRIHLES